MDRTAVGHGAGWLKAVRFAAIALAGGLLAAGCRSGGGGGGGSGIPTTLGPDEHGNQPLQATVIIPDGANIRGRINYGGDIDFFRFRGIQGIGYTLQITGFPMEPGLNPNLDLTDQLEGFDFLAAQILNFTGATDGGQIENSTGTLGGDAYDISPPDGDDFVVGDSRIFWVCPNTNDYFIRIEHRRELTSVGTYNLRLASSQSTTILGGEPIFQSGGHDYFIVNDQGEIQFQGWISAAIQAGRFEYNEQINAITGGNFGVAGNRQIFLPDSDTPEPYVAHLHDGFPDIYEPSDSSAQPPSGDNHPFILSQEFPSVNNYSLTIGRDETPQTQPARASGEANVTLADGRQLRIPVSSEIRGGLLKINIHFEDALIDGRTITGADWLAPANRRLLHGFPWYVDVHPMDPTTPGAVPIVASLPMMDWYQFFETHFEATADNVLRSDGSRLPAERGGVTMGINYDAALKTFQTGMLQYIVDGGIPPNVGVFAPDDNSAAFEGQRVRVHRGGRGQVGPVVIDLGTVPEPRLPGFNLAPGDLIAEPGFRNPIRQLTDAEAELLRDLFYGEGFYVEVTDRFTGEPLVRAEGDELEISILPFAEPCSFPPCLPVRNEGVPQKGTVTFASSLVGEGSVDFFANGELLGAFTKTVTQDNLPGCGLDGDDRTLAVELWPGTYYWHANGADGKIWDGFFTVTAGECHLVVIGPDDLQ